MPTLNPNRLSWPWLQALGSKPGAYYRKLEEYVARGWLSYQREGNYSIVINGQLCNYRLNGRELFIASRDNASALVRMLKSHSKRRKGNPKAYINVDYVENPKSAR